MRSARPQKMRESWFELNDLWWRRIPDWAADECPRHEILARSLKSHIISKEWLIDGRVRLAGYANVERWWHGWQS
jgi:hypothetical protein